MVCPVSSRKGTFSDFFATYHHNNANVITPGLRVVNSQLCREAMEGKVEKSVSLNLLAEKIIPQPVDSDQLAYCPTMDLLAVGSKDDQVHVFRLNGQRVFGASSGKLALQIRRLRWKPTGELYVQLQHRHCSRSGDNVMF